MTFISFVFLGCTKEITLKQAPYDSQISIESLITPGEYPKVYMNKTLPYLTVDVINSLFFARNASITMTDDNSVIQFHADSVFNYFQCEYIYFYLGNKIIEVNKTYQLNIDYNSVNYSGSATTNQPIVLIDNIDYVPNFLDLSGEHEGITLSFQDNPTVGQYYRFEMRRFADSTAYKPSGGKTPCINGLTVPVKEIGRTIYSDQNTNNLGLTITFEPSFKHKEGDETYIFLQVLDKNAFDFFDQIDRQKQGLFNPFIEPTFIKFTQFKNAFGCFSAYSLSDSVKFIYPE